MAAVTHAVSTHAHTHTHTHMHPHTHLVQKPEPLTQAHMHSFVFAAEESGMILEDHAGLFGREHKTQLGFKFS